MRYSRWLKYDKDDRECNSEIYESGHRLEYKKVDEKRCREAGLIP